MLQSKHEYHLDGRRFEWIVAWECDNSVELATRIRRVFWPGDYIMPARNVCVRQSAAHHSRIFDSSGRATM